jgi:diguanylate cyclase (GGDEF)-like protein
MFVDIDRFKLVNDGIGHGGGDRILMLLGERLLAAVRAGETVGRFGGDEFVIDLRELADARCQGAG